MAGDPARAGVLMVASFPDSIIDFRGALIDAWLAAGEVVHVAAPGLSATSPVGAELARRGACVHHVALQRTGRNPLADLRTVVQLFRLMRRVRPRYLLAYTVKPVVYALLAGWLARVPHRFALITGLGYAFQPGGGGRAGVRGVVRRLYRAALARAETVLFQNADDLALFRQSEILAPGARTVVVDGSGVDLDAFPERPVPPGAPRFLMIARLLGDKGVREYAQAAAMLRARDPAATFALAGWLDDGNPDSIARAELERWTGSGDIVFLGRLGDVREALAECSVYVLPSYREGMPRTVLEAMSTGRAIVTTDVPGCRETVVEGGNGFLVPARSPAGLAGAMARFLGAPELAARMGRRSRRIAAERFDVHRVNARMLRAMGIAARDTAARRERRTTEDGGDEAGICGGPEEGNHG